MGISNPDIRNSCLENQQENNKYSVFANVTSQRSWIIKAILEESVLWTSKEWRLLLKILFLYNAALQRNNGNLEQKVLGNETVIGIINITAGQLPIKFAWRDAFLALQDFFRSNKHCIHLSETKTIYFSRFVFAMSVFAPVDISYSNK